MPAMSLCVWELQLECTVYVNAEIEFYNGIGKLEEFLVECY
jgi:hypothetical protein